MIVLARYPTYIHIIVLFKCLLLVTVTWVYMEYSFCCGGSGAFRCELMPTPLNFTCILHYDYPCFVRMRNSFTSVELSTCRLVILLTYQPDNLSTCQPVDLPTCQPVDLSIFRPVNLSTCQPVDLSTFCWLLLVCNFL